MKLYEKTTTNRIFYFKVENYKKNTYLKKSNNNVIFL